MSVFGNVAAATKVNGDSATAVSIKADVVLTPYYLWRTSHLSIPGASSMTPIQAEEPLTSLRLALVRHPAHIYLAYLRPITMFR